MIKEAAISNIKGLNKGKEFKFLFPVSRDEVENQLNEIFGDEVYKLGRRKKNAVYLDVGANIGLASLYFEDWAKTIYAIEPSSECFISLTKNTEQIDKIKVFNYAMTENNLPYQLYGKDKGSTPQTLIPDKDQNPTLKEEVKGKSFPVFFEENNITHVDVMKIDIEGYEYALLASPSFAKVADKIDFIIGESHYSPDGGKPMFIAEILKEYGFTTKFTHHRNYISNLQIHYGKDLVKKYEVHLNTIFYAERKNK